MIVTCIVFCIMYCSGLVTLQVMLRNYGVGIMLQLNEKKLID